ncbi:P-loop containing nucleoside triphosphate hydrolase protein, partial [Auricularia subglabra TFB-10046 SS5]
EEPREQSVHGIRLRPVSELPDVFRGLFKFSVFNAVQSKCFETVCDHSTRIYPIIMFLLRRSYRIRRITWFLETLQAAHAHDERTAPTGSGKTVLFELAIIRMIANDGSKSSKCVYMAPTKALCSERFRDWSTKFEPLGIKCCELTGDTVTYGKGAWGDAYASRIIVTTPEKWDSLTRHWAEHEDILATMKLFLVDEVHILNESRGSTLEVCIARMKLRGNAVRFVLVSATAPNISDIAAWIGRRGSLDEPAEMFTFGEEFRPCQLKRFVYAYPPKPSEFQFQKTLDFKLFSHLQTHSVNKPILVFCPTRKGTVQTAEQLMKDYKQAKSNRQALPWHAPHKYATLGLQGAALAEAGIGVHHAGVIYSDRGLTEELYSKKILRVIVATSTLAVGVNLPAHTVVIKGTKLFQGQAWCEYSEADIFQMMGRAGRPQFDKDGIVIIMTSTLDESKYHNLVGGQTNLESFLHHNLAEHINSEVGLGTITNVDGAKTWLQNSFFYQRIQKNPAHYRLDKASTQTWSQRLEELVVASLDDLKTTGLVSQEAEDPHKLVATEFGDIMSKYYIRLSTMKLFLDMPMNTSLKSIVCSRRQDLRNSVHRISSSWKSCVRRTIARTTAYLPQIYNKLREHNDIRFKTNKVEKTSDKVFVLIQAILGGISLSDKEYELGGQVHLDAIPIIKHCPRFARAIADIGIAKQSGSLTKYGLELLRCFHAKAWEGRPVVLRQIEHLGDKSFVLSQHGITSFSKLREQDQIRLEALLNRRPPFGLDVLAAAKELPDFDIKIVDASVETRAGKGEVHCTLTVECSVSVELSKQKRRKQKQALGSTSVLTITSDEEFIDFRNISTRALAREAKTFTIEAKLSKPSQYIEVSIAADNFAGVLRVVTWKPDVHAREFPVPDTRPKTAIVRSSFLP